MSIPKKVRQALIERSHGRCQICNYPANNAHHRKNRSQGGRDVLSNLMLLCGSGVTGCHGYVTAHPQTAGRNGWTVWSYENPAEKPVFIWATRWVLLGDDGSIAPYEQAAS